MSLSPAPLSLLIKAAPILTEDMYSDIQPAAWELLLSVDEHMAAAAGNISLIAIHTTILYFKVNESFQRCICSACEK